MANEMTFEEIKAECDSEWVLIGDPELDETLEVKSGELLYHSKSRDEVHRKAREVKKSRIAVLYLGTIPKDSVIVL